MGVFFFWRQRRNRRIERESQLALEDNSNYSAIKPIQSMIVNEKVFRDVVIKERLGGGNFGNFSWKFAIS